MPLPLPLFSAFRLSVAFALLASLLVAPRPLVGGETAATLTDEPSASVAATMLAHASDHASGWRMYWRADQGRRELIQHWIAADDAPLHGIELAIHSGTNAPLDNARLVVALSTAKQERVALAGPLSTEVFRTEIDLPANAGHQAYRRGRWLRITFPAAKLKAGASYALHLAFAAEKPGPQDVVFSVEPFSSDTTETASGFRQDGAEWKWWRNQSRLGALRIRLLHEAPSVETRTSVSEPRILRIDPRDPAAFPTLKAAAALARPGDTLWLAPESGPYREELSITTSGTADAPITIEGNGNEITGFDPVRFAATPDGGHVADIGVDYPFVLRHRGTRILEDATTRRFTSGASYSANTKRLTLAPGVSPEDWEVSGRTFVVRLRGVSHHRYRDLVASGALNDGFNLHGAGSGLRFENITGCHNLDEGFSAHGDMDSEIIGGRFFGNDNGVYNIERSHTRLQNVDIRDNLGIGLCASQARIDAENVRVWANGMAQVLVFNRGDIRAENLSVHRNPRSARAWVTYKESARWAAPVTLNDAASTIPGLRRLETNEP